MKRRRIQKKYSAKEIAEMREILRDINTPIGVCYYQKDVDRVTELQLLTYMNNGTTAKELAPLQAEKWERAVAAQRAYQVFRNSIKPLEKQDEPKVEKPAIDSSSWTGRVKRLFSADFP